MQSSPAPQGATEMVSTLQAMEQAKELKQLAAQLEQALKELDAQPVVLASKLLLLRGTQVVFARQVMEQSTVLKRKLVTLVTEYMQKVAILQDMGLSLIPSRAVLDLVSHLVPALDSK